MAKPSETKDLYERLSLERDASEEEIKLSYRRLAMKYHPDRNPNDPDAEEQFKAVAGAYEVLINSSKRQMYDAGFSPNGTYQTRGPTQGPDMDLGDAFKIFSSVFGMMNAVYGKNQKDPFADMMRNMFNIVDVLNKGGKGTGTKFHFDDTFKGFNFEDILEKTLEGLKEEQRKVQREQEEAERKQREKEEEIRRKKENTLRRKIGRNLESFLHKFKK